MRPRKSSWINHGQNRRRSDGPDRTDRGGTSCRPGERHPRFQAGDTIRVGYKVTEGSRSRVQNYEGVCISRKNGNGIAGSFTVRKISFGEGVERVVPAALDQHRRDHRGPPWPCASLETLLPALASRQIGPYRGRHQLQVQTSLRRGIMKKTPIPTTTSSKSK